MGPKMIIALGALLAPSRAQVQDMLGSCNDIRMPDLGNVRAVLSNVTKQHTCSNIVPEVTFQNILNRCDAFCGPTAVPIVVGTDSVGFNKEAIDSICMGGSDTPVLEFNLAKISNCREWGQSLDQVNLRAADFIAAVRNLTYEQLIYRATMQEKVTEMQTVLTSAETQSQMSLALRSQKLGVLRNIIDDNLDDLMGDSLLKLGLTQKLEQLERKSIVLTETIESALPNLLRYVDECNDLLLATGPLNEYMLDICSVTSSACMDHEEAEHVACCCGVIPSVGSSMIPAAGQRPPSRRAQELLSVELEVTDTSVSGSVDVCGAAYQSFAVDYDDTVSRLEAITGGESLLETFNSQQEDLYPDFFDTSCEVDATPSTRRLRKDGQGRRLQQQPKQSEPQPPQQPGLAFLEERKLQSGGPLYLTCNPPSEPTDQEVINNTDSFDLPSVAFWAETEQALCKNIVDNGMTMTTERLATMCSEFCEPTSVPLLLGTTEFGFSHEQMDEICLAPDSGGAKFNQTAVNQCHEKATSFALLQEKAAEFAASLQVLSASKIVFAAEAQAAGQNLKDEIRARGQAVLDDSSRSQRIAAFESLIRLALEDVIGTNSRSKRQLREDAAAMGERARELKTKLDEVLPDVRDFLTNCNQLTTGVSGNKKYLLDFCSQGSTNCIEHEEGEHVGCCCGYNPIVTLGTAGVAANTPSISGISGIGEWTVTTTTLPGAAPAPAAAPSPPADTAQVQGGSSSGGGSTSSVTTPEVTSINICARAQEISKAAVEVHREAVEALGQSPLWLTSDCENRVQYPAYFERCTDNSICVGVEVSVTSPPGYVSAATQAAADAAAAAADMASGIASQGRLRCSSLSLPMLVLSFGLMWA